ncbi:hypothetical protein QYS49_00640 [Marivirga salinae]|uniref:Receptor L-domain domain-containing protein n=1 Tax=Marivirga salinarum TaxID=3059078 RepID=A0AA49GAS9_9BACT|nr:hypothetical protein [Marivirga sp. BDSF4-3]WKK75993.2 hypothetical protein QYS49_00640 [Marivirga sp. BDSF4-3]
MRNLSLILTLFYFVSCNPNDETTELKTHLEGDLELLSLADFQKPEVQAYRIISGTLSIKNTYEIEDLSLLKNLVEVNGIIILNNKDLKSLAGLENIKQLEFLEIKNNQSLTSLEGLENLSEISSSFSLYSNRTLENLTPLNGLTRVGEQLFIFDNSQLSDLSGLENLVECPKLLILNNIRLVNIEGLEGISSSSDIRIDSNDSLTDFCSLTKFIKANKESIYFIARHNVYNPTIEDMVQDKCSN